MCGIIKKFIFFIVLCLLWASTCFAETYQNTDYNFQLEIPNEWQEVQDNSGKHLICRKIIQNRSIPDLEWAGFVIDIKQDNGSSENATADDLTPAQRKGILDQVNGLIKSKYPTAQITYSGYNHFGENGFLVTKANYRTRDNVQVRLTFVSTFFHRTYYFGALGTSAKEDYEQQFFDILKTLQPIY